MTKSSRDKFWDALLKAYNAQRDIEHVEYVSLHAIAATFERDYGWARDHFTKALDAALGAWITEGRRIAIEVDATPTEHHRYRNRPIVVDGVERFCISMRGDITQ